MKIAISAEGNNLSDKLDQRFGRAAWFLIVDPETMEYEAVDNGSVASSGGAGISAAQNVVDKGVDVIITGNVGPNAMNILKVAEVSIYKGQLGSIRENIAMLKEGKLELVDSAVASHFGMTLSGVQK